VKSILVSTTPIIGIAVWPDGCRAIASYGGASHRLWDLKTGKDLGRFEGVIEKVAFSPDGRYLLTGAGDKKVRLCDAETGKEIRQLIGHTNAICSVAFSPDSRRALTAGGDGTIRLWDVATGKELHRFEKFQGWLAKPRNGNVSSVFAAFSPDGRHAFSGGTDGVGRLWRLPDPPAAKEKP
jgi:WD40 repeat protein